MSRRRPPNLAPKPVQLSYGDAVEVMRGPHRGLIGEYDDDGDRAGTICVHAFDTTAPPCVEVRVADVRKVKQVWVPA